MRRPAAARDGAPRFRHLAAQSRQAVVTAPLVVLVRIRPLGQLFDQPLVQQSLDRRVEAARAEAQRAARALGDVEQDGVSVPIAVGQGDEDVKRVAMQREEVLGPGSSSRDDRMPQYSRACYSESWKSVDWIRRLRREAWNVRNRVGPETSSPGCGSTSNARPSNGCFGRTWRPCAGCPGLTRGSPPTARTCSRRSRWRSGPRCRGSAATPPNEPGSIAWRTTRPSGS